MIIFSRLISAFYLGTVFILPMSIAAAQVKAPPPQILFDSFSGNYYLSRDSRGLSLLTSQETITASFPGAGNFYGIKRAIPKQYQNHNVNIKILNITDAAGNSVPYKTSDGPDNSLVVTTGDPAINLYGNQTFKINYQTSGVINLGKKDNELLLNVNGRGWDQPFNKVNAALHIPASFNSSLKDNPSCYVALGQSTSNNCEIKTQKSSQETIVTSSTSNVAAHQALVLKLEFASSTFTNKHPFSDAILALISAVLLILGFFSFSAYKKRKKA
jgi:hypothetical protein